MKLVRGVAALTLALVGAGTLAAQANGRAVVFQVFGGGASHLRNLNATGNVADFKLGFDLGGAIGFQLNEYLGLHGDFTFTRNQASGLSTFTGTNFNRYFYGGHLEASYPGKDGFAPFVFAGAGAVTVHQAIASPTIAGFSKPAAMFGLGFRYEIPKSPIEVIMEGKSLLYKWDAGGYARTMWDLTYSAGLAYRLGF